MDAAVHKLEAKDESCSRSSFPSDGHLMVGLRFETEKHDPLMIPKNVANRFNKQWNPCFQNLTCDGSMIRSSVFHFQYIPEQFASPCF
jgi:hypothetical protein